MRTRLIVLLAPMLLALPANAAAQVVFDGTSYVQAHTAAKGTSRLYEFVPRGQRLTSWKELISVQCHPGAKSLRDVIQPYMASRSKFSVAKPRVVTNAKGTPPSDVSVVLLLGTGKEPHVELSLARFVQSPGKGVYAAIFSKRYPVKQGLAATARDAEIGRWLAELGKVPAATLRRNCTATPGA